MAVTYFLQRFANPALDSFFLLATQLAEEVVLILIIGITYWCTDKRFARPYLSAIACNMGVNAFFKNIFRVPRLFHSEFPKVRVVDAAVTKATGYSFPSGHTQFATAVYGGLGAYKKGVLRLLLFFVVLLVGVSRIYLGVHTVYDVLFALAAGILSTLFCMRYYERLIAKNIWFSMLFALPAVLCMLLVDPSAEGDTFQTAGLVTGVFLGIVLDEKYIHYDTKTTFARQFVKVVIGIAAALFLQNGLKFLFFLFAAEDSVLYWFLTFVRYFLIGTWVTAGLPFLAKKFRKNK